MFSEKGHVRDIYSDFGNYLESVPIENINKMQELLNKIEIKSVKPKILLSSFIIYFFPEFVLDNLELNEDEKILYNNTRDIINYSDNESNIFKSKVLLFAINFEKWKEGDRKKFTNNLFHVYHNLTIDKMNSNDDNEKKKQIDVCKNIVLECSEKIGGEKLKIFFTPGHSPGHICLYNKKHNILISGDVIFMNSIGRTDLPGGNYKTLIDSIKTKIINLPEETNIFCGHGPSTTLIKEKINNPFLN